MRILLPLLCATTLLASDSDYEKFDARAMLGINMTPPSSSTQAANGTEPTVGVEAQQVYPGTAAERMGIQPGDLIVAVNGGGIGSMNDLRNEVALTGVGGQATVEVLRNGQKLVLNDALSEWPTAIPYEPIDEAAERRFRDWQSRRLDHTQQAVANLKKQVEDLERRTNAASQPKAKPAVANPAQAMAMPASEALSALPAFRLHLRHSHDALDSGSVQTGRQVAWDARVLIGTTPPIIF
jgi:membrane-associated protease RseP (regulator of RpoE activity)